VSIHFFHASHYMRSCEAVSSTKCAFYALKLVLATREREGIILMPLYIFRML